MAPYSRLKVLALVMAVIATTQSFGQSRRSRQMLEQANESLAAGLHNRAAELYSNVIEETPDIAEARYRRAVAYSNLGEGQKALDDLSVLLLANPKHAEGLQLRGNILLEKDRPANAIESYSRAMQSGLKTAAVFNGRAAAYAKLQQWDKAIADYGEGIRLRLDNPVAYRDRGVANASLGRWQDSIEDFDRAIALKPDYWEAYVERAHTFGMTGRFDAVMPDLNKVLAAEPANPRALGLRGSAYMIADDAGKAIADYSMAIQANPRDVQLLLSRGAAYTRAGEHAKSLADREAAVRLRPRMPDTYIARGGSYHELGEHEKGLADRSEAIRLAPGSAIGWIARGNAYFLLSRYSEAASDLRKAIELMPEDKPTRDLLEKAEARMQGAGRVEVASPEYSQRSAAPVEAKVSALTVESILDLPRQPDPGPAAEASAVPVERASVSPAVSDQAVFTAPPAVATTPPVVSEPAAPQPNKAEKPAPPAPILSAEQLNQQGRALIAERKYQEAIAVLTRALAIKPNHTLVLNARGFAYLMLRKFEPALADLDKAISLDPKYANAYHNRSIVLQRLGKAQAAEEDRRTEQSLLAKR